MKLFNLEHYNAIHGHHMYFALPVTNFWVLSNTLLFIFKLKSTSSPCWSFFTEGGEGSQLRAFYDNVYSRSKNFRYVMVIKWFSLSVWLFHYEVRSGNLDCMKIKSCCWFMSVHYITINVLLFPLVLNFNTLKTHKIV